jgi:putative zinc finger/helix-turn-helix YgiT family protein
MSERISCSRCEAVRDVELMEREETARVKGREVTFTSHFYRCTTCGEELQTAEQLDESLDAAREAYARQYETPSPERLAELRARYGASQKAFGLLLGFGEPTMNNYEKGSIPNPPNRLLLKLAENPVIFRAVYEENKNRIGATQRRRIEESEGYRAGETWYGMGSLYLNLSSEERSNLQSSAEQHGVTVARQVATVVSAQAENEISVSLAGARWSGAGSSGAISRTGNDWTEAAS